MVADRVLSSKSQGFESNVKNSTIQSNVERRATYGYGSQRAGAACRGMPDALAYSEANNSLYGYCSVNPCSKGKHDFGERLQVEAVLCSLGELLHTEFLVPVNSTKPECEPGGGAQRSDNVVCHAERDISVCGLRILR